MRIRPVSGEPVFPIGIGTFNIASRENPLTADALRYVGYKNVEAVRGNEVREIGGLVYSLENGQNYIDTAGLYGGGYTNEVVGKAIGRAAIPREDLFISGNVWKAQYGSVREAVGKMLADLNIEYLDVAGPHSPHTTDWGVPTWQETIPVFSQLIDEGLVHGLSVSNFTIAHMEEVMKLTKASIVTAQMGFSPLYQKEVTPEFREYCDDKGIQIVAYQVLQPKVNGQFVRVTDHEVVKAIAGSRNATPAQVVLAWAIQMGTLPITKALKPEHIRENLKAVDVVLDDKEMRQLTKLGSVAS